MNKELDRIINDFNITLINYIIEEIQKIIFINHQKNPVDLYNVIRYELNHIYAYIENTYKLKLSEDVYSHVEEYISSYKEDAQKELEERTQNKRKH